MRIKPCNHTLSQELTAYANKPTKQHFYTPPQSRLQNRLLVRPCEQNNRRCPHRYTQIWPEAHQQRVKRNRPDKQKRNQA